MTFKEFASWCNQRACDGLWGYGAAKTCSIACSDMYKYNGLIREHKWRKYEHKNLLESLVRSVNSRIEEVRRENGIII